MEGQQATGTAANECLQLEEKDDDEFKNRYFFNKFIYSFR
jgi:hypothetical protein